MSSCFPRGNIARKWLRTFHLYLACVWGGGGSSLFAIHCLYRPNSGPELYARNLALLYVDNYILVPSAIGCMVTGIVYCHLNGWGYLKYHWVIVKLASNSIFLLAGFFWFIPWIDRMVETSLTRDRFMEIDHGYAAAMQVHMAMAAGQALLVFVLVVVSVFKPWGRTRINF